MKKLFLLSLFALTVSAQTVPLVPIIVRNLLPNCTAKPPALLMWTGTNFDCLNLGTGFTVSLPNNTINVNIPSPPPSSPQWQIDTVSLTSSAATSTGIAFTTTKTPVGGVVWSIYVSGNVFTNTLNILVFTQNPLSLTLPSGWSNTDYFLLVYEVQ